MNPTGIRTSEVQFVVGEDWSFGPSRKLVAIPVINGDISREAIEADSVERLASNCARELDTSLIVCAGTPLLRPDYLRDAGDRRASHIMTARDEEVYRKLNVADHVRL